MTRAARVATAAATLAFVAAINLPYAALIQLFGYDDVLRRPAGEVLDRFAAAGAPLVLAWLAFAAGALTFAPLSRAVERAAGLTPGWTGVASAFAQFAGLARWAFAVPALATAHVEGDAAARATAETLYRVLHQYLGVGVGELLGQALLVAWSARLALRFAATGRRWLAAAGLATLPLWLLGMSEPLATVAPMLPTLELTPLAFMAWEAWLVGIALVWLVDGWSRSAPVLA